MIVADVFLFVLGILLIVFGSRTLRDWMAQRAALGPRDIPPEMRILAEEVAQLRDRIQVLERVITDNHGSIELDRQIERLRDR